jgi:hypothetical protein
VLIAALLALSSPSAAQDVLVVVENGSPEARSRSWRERVEAELGTPLTTLSAWAASSEPVDSVTPDRLEVLARIDELVVRARESAVRLEERDALQSLARAEELAIQHLDVPGMAAWYAEIELAIALTAAQAELGGLADAALSRAASVDPSRAVQVGEARPELVERSRAALRALATGPRGRFEVSASVPGARAYLDDRLLGSLPRAVEAARGTHVLRIEAPVIARGLDDRRQGEAGASSCRRASLGSDGEAARDGDPTVARWRESHPLDPRRLTVWAPAPRIARSSRGDATAADLRLEEGDELAVEPRTCGQPRLWRARSTWCVEEPPSAGTWVAAGLPPRAITRSRRRPAEVPAR